MSEKKETPWEFIPPTYDKSLPFKPSRRTIKINELTFTLVKATKPITIAFIEFHALCEEAMVGAADNVRTVFTEHPKYGKLPIYDRWDYYLDLLQFICVEDVKSVVSEDDLDMDEAERAISDFLPESMRLAATLVGFLNTSQS